MILWVGRTNWSHLRWLASLTRTAEYRDPIYAAWMFVCSLVALQVCNGRIWDLLMAEASVPHLLGRVVQASRSYKPREQMVRRGPLRGSGKRGASTL